MPSTNPSPRAGVGRRGLDQLRELVVAPPERRDPERDVVVGRDARRLGGRSDLVEQRLGEGDLARDGADIAEMAQDERHRRQRPVAAGALELTLGENPPRLVVPEVGCRVARKREPTWGDVGFAQEAAQGRLQDRRPRGETLGVLNRPALEEEIGRPWRLWGRRTGEHGLADLDNACPAGQPAGKARRLKGHQVGRSGQARDISAKRVRRAALHHALLSYVFGTVIVAITVSSVAGLLGR
jgi:hypothetical protein